jgi:hypothetical protein
MDTLLINDINDVLSDITDDLSDFDFDTYDFEMTDNLLDIVELKPEIKCEFVSEEFYKEFMAMFKFIQRFTETQKELVKLVLIEYIELGKIIVEVEEYNEMLYSEDEIDVKYNVILLLIDNNITTINRMLTQSRNAKINKNITLDVCKAPYIGLRYK